MAEISTNKNRTIYENGSNVYGSNPILCICTFFSPIKQEINTPTLHKGNLRNHLKLLRH